ncbi:ATP-binding cassette domain-containing protein [Candidatus Bathyarchaeota archaeon]|nr:ATP-binding cassette domain-containing protein [Candidatus Bathyarchaeota archaeon]MBS7613834.1 ATP-binding cassette domain-containing protein [Candidatus Bathyarchaeota archaeon]
MVDFAVQAKNLVKVYNGKVKALDGVDLTVEASGTFALLGPNGAGKTTLMRILTTQLKPSTGEAYVFGLNVTRDGGKVRKLVSYVPQEMSVWTDISGYENLLIYAKIFGIPRLEREKMIDEALDIMGLNNVKGELVRTYSGGMVRRLEIACAMLVKPKIMFLDEPTIGLDPGARKIVWEKLNLFKKEYGVTIFFNTHYMDEADLYADDIAIIDQGKVVARGTSEELKHSVGGEIISFTLENFQSESWLLEEIRRLKLVRGVFMENKDLNILVDDAESSLPCITDFLKSKALSVNRISITKPTLDDVFLKYTGGRLEEKGRISDVRQVRYMIRRG